MSIFEPSIFLAMFPYAFMAAFPIFGIIVITKLELDRRRRSKKLNSFSTLADGRQPKTEPAADERMLN